MSDSPGVNRVIVEGLGKRYVLPSKRRAAAEARRTVNLGFARISLPGFLRRRGSVGRDLDLWALRDVSFAVPEGTILGIIGPNGAGKSTLLKIIARVTRPTEGRVIGRGRVVSLLELGAGFNPDFSARENILMNGAMHGIPRREVLERMDEIVQFAGLDQFADSPLRHYSSGMYLRLAFSVAINMDPDILLADEILAVGDMAFQERCLERVAEEARRGLTVFFVSHDMAAVSRLCDRLLWLDQGRLVRDGDPESVLAQYQQAALGATKYGDRRGRDTNVAAEIASVRLLNAAGEAVGAAAINEDIFIRIRLKIRKPGTAVRGVVDVQTKGVFLFRAVQREEVIGPERGVLDLTVRIPAHLLAETTYTVGVTVQTRHGKESKIVLPTALTFMAYANPHEAIAYKGGSRTGLISPRLDWHVIAHSNVHKRKSVV